MNKFLAYFALLIFASCTCGDQGSFTQVPTTGYVVTFPDGRVNTYEFPNGRTLGGDKVKPQGQTQLKRQQAPTPPSPVTKKPTPVVKREAVPSNQRTPLNNILPSACKLIDGDWLKNLVKTKEDIKITDASTANSPSVKSCFFKWPDSDMPNSGIFLQIIENPVPAEVSNYGNVFIQGKLKSGETDMSGTTFKYNPYKEVGIAGAYSTDQGKYFWQVDPERVIMLALNLGLSSRKQKSYADAIAKHVMSNYKK